MDDSLDAFQTPDLSKVKSISMGRKRKISKAKKINIDKKSNKIDINDTMYGLDNLDNENILTDCNSSSNLTNNNNNSKISNMDTFSTPKSTAKTEKTSKLQPTVTYSPGGICSLCKIKIPKEECESHRQNCMRIKFGSRRTMKCELKSKLKCKYCAKDINISDIRSHENECKDKPETIKSSYFSNTNPDTVCCPTCNMDLSNYDELKRTHHVNKCLDKTVNPVIETMSFGSSSSNQNEKVSCSECNKTFKTSRGLKTHFNRKHKNASENNSTNENPENKRRSLKPPKNVDEENIALAKAISASECSEQKLRKKKEKRKKKEPEIPAMIQISPNSRRKAFGERLQQIFEKKDEDYEISSTPQLPVSNSTKWNFTSELNQNNEINEPILHTIEQNQIVEQENNKEIKNPFSPKQAPFVILTKLNEKQFLNTDSPEDNKNNKATLSEFNLAVSEDADIENSVDSNAIKPSKFLRKKSNWALSSCKDLNAEDFRVDQLLTTTQFGPIKTYENILELQQDNAQTNECGSVDSTEVKSKENQDNIEIDKVFTNFEAKNANDKTVDFCSSSNENNDHENLNLMSEQNHPISNNTIDMQDNIVDLTQDNSENLESQESKNSFKFKENNILSLNQVGNDLKNCINTPTFSDLTMIFECGSKIYLHKFILLCRCPLLLKVLEDGCYNDMYQVTECSHTEFKTLVDYIYSGDADDIKALQNIAQKFVNKPDSFSFSPQLQCCTTENSNLFSHMQTKTNISTSKSNAQEYKTQSNKKSLENDSELINTSTDLIQDNNINSTSIKNSNLEKNQSQKSVINDEPFKSSSLNATNNNGGFCAKQCDDNEDIVCSDEDLFGPPENWIPIIVNETCFENNFVESNPKTPIKPFVNKRTSDVITPCFSNRHKTMRMTGSTPKWENLNTNKNNLMLGSDIQNVSSIMATPNLNETSKLNNSKLVSFNNLSILQDRLSYQRNIDFKENSIHENNKTENDDEILSCSFRSNEFQYISDNEISTNQDNNEKEKLEEQNRKSVDYSFSQPILSNKSPNSKSEKILEPVKYKFRKTKKKSTTPLKWEEIPSVLENPDSFLSPNVNIIHQKFANMDKNQIKTPQQRKRRNSTGNSFTPMPNYSDMDTPHILEYGKKIGLKKALGKKKLKLKLKEAFAWKHQYSDSSDDEVEVNISHGTPVLPKQSSELYTEENPVQIERKKLFSDFESQSDEESSLKDQKRKKIEIFVQKSQEKLESLTNKEFSKQMLHALNLLQKRGQLELALEREAKLKSGIARGSRIEMEMWMEALNVDSDSFNKNLSILLGLSQTKQDTISQVLTKFTARHQNIKGINLYLLNIIPTIYRAMLRLNPSLEPIL